MLQRDSISHALLCNPVGAMLPELTVLCFPS